MCTVDRGREISRETAEELSARVPFHCIWFLKGLDAVMKEGSITVDTSEMPFSLTKQPSLGSDSM